METWSCTVSLQACINWWGYINWSNTAFPLELLFLCSPGRDETVVCNKGDGGCIMNEMEDCRKTKEAISWSRWFNATLEKLRCFFFFLCKRLVLRQVIMGVGGGDLPQVAAWFYAETLRSWSCTHGNAARLQLLLKMPVVVFQTEKLLHSTNYCEI